MTWEKHCHHCKVIFEPEWPCQGIQPFKGAGVVWCLGCWNLTCGQDRKKMHIDDLKEELAALEKSQ